MSNRKKILVFIDWYLPGFKAGGPIRSCAAIVFHLKKYADFYIVTRDKDYCETLPYKNIQSNQWNKISDGENVFYISSKELNASTIKKIILSDQFSTIYINGIYSFFFSILPLYFSKRYQKSVIVAPRGMLAKSAVKVKGFKKNIFIAASKFFRLYHDIIFHSTANQEEKDIFETISKKTRVTYAPNLSVVKKGNFIKREKKIGELRLINVARISPEKNLLFALEILKGLSIEIKFDIYGPIYDQDYWKQCLVLIGKMNQLVKIEYHGSIENQLLPEKLEEAHFLLMPTRGENFGHIIIESLAAGCPVIISDQTPWKNLEEKNIGWDISLSNLEEFRNVIKNCWNMNQDQYDVISNNSFTFAGNVLNSQENIDLNKKLFNL